MPEKAFNHIIISRTDSIGDVMLTLPMCGVIKAHYPQCRISFIGRSYTKDIIASCAHVDAFINCDDLEKMPFEAAVQQLKETQADTIIHAFPDKFTVKAAAKARIRTRIATAKRWQTLWNTNTRVFFSRKKSDLHESQLNIKLLAPLGILDIPTLAEMPDYYGFQAKGKSPDALHPMLRNGRRNIILHPLSKGSAVNWSLSDFNALAQMLAQHECNVFVSGTAAEGEKIKTVFSFDNPYIIDITGKMNLSEFIAFIHDCDVLVAASTGPLHIAAALGLHAVGLYSPKRPIHPGRWAPVGIHAHVITAAFHPENGALPITPDKGYSFVLGLK